MGGKTIVPEERIERRILSIRNQRVLLDADLAEAYEVTTKRLNEQVRRNLDRFPEDFMFQLTAAEVAALRSQNATLKAGRGGHRKYRPYAFTEHGALMVANVLKSATAVQTSILVVRAFVRVRRLAASHAWLSARLAELERRVGTHDSKIKEVFVILHELLEPPTVDEKKSQIGFGAE